MMGFGNKCEQVCVAIPVAESPPVLSPVSSSFVSKFINLRVGSVCRDIRV